MSEASPVFYRKAAINEHMLSRLAHGEKENPNETKIGRRDEMHAHIIMKGKMVYHDCISQDVRVTLACQSPILSYTFTPSCVLFA